MQNKVYNVLFLCTGNSARSVLAEALLNSIGNGRFVTYSAGSQPKGHVHPCALEVLREQNISTESYRSKSWDALARIRPSIEALAQFFPDESDLPCLKDQLQKISPEAD